MAHPSDLELGGLAALGTLGSVCAVLLRSTNKNLESLQQMRDNANNVVDQLRAELHDNDTTISKLQALCAESHRRYAVYRYHIGALRAERKQLRLECQKLERCALDRLQRAAGPLPNQIQNTKEES